MVIAAFSFGETILLEFLKAFFTAGLVAVGAGLAVWWVQRTAATKREQFAVATDLLEQTSECAGEMYYTTQVFYRQAEYPEVWGKCDDDALDMAYRSFGVTGEQIEWELRARYGPTSSQREMWHQVRDLLTIRYFMLKDQNTAGLRAVNASGYENRAHTGLSETDLESATLVLNTFRSTMDNLAEGLVKGSARL